MKITLIIIKLQIKMSHLVNKSSFLWTMRMQKLWKLFNLWDSYLRTFLLVSSPVFDLFRQVVILLLKYAFKDINYTFRQVDRQVVLWLLFVKSTRHSIGCRKKEIDTFGRIHSVLIVYDRVMIFQGICDYVKNLEHRN